MAQRPGNFNHVLLRHRKLLQLVIGIKVRIDAFQKLGRALAHLRPVYKFLARHVAHEDILGHAQFIEHHRFLMDCGNAGSPGIARRLKLAKLAAHGNFPGIRTVDARENFHDRRFARPVLAHQRRHFAGAQRERNIVQRANTGK